MVKQIITMVLLCAAGASVIAVICYPDNLMLGRFLALIWGFSVGHITRKLYAKSNK